MAALWAIGSRGVAGGSTASMIGWRRASGSIVAMPRWCARTLARELGILVSLRTVERAVTPLRQALRAEARACVRFETPPGKQLQIDFGETVAGGSRPSQRLQQRGEELQNV